MNTWTKHSLAYLSKKIGSGGTPARIRRAEFFTQEGGHLWVKSKELLERGISDTEERITDAGLKNSPAKYYPENTVLVAMYGVNAGQLAWLQRPATVNQAICALEIDPAKADWRFVYYSLLNNRAELVRQARGAAQPNLNKEMVSGHEITICTSISTQQNIASVISAYDDLIEMNNRRIKALEDMAQLLYSEWLVKFKFPGHKKAKMIDSGTEYGAIPEGWKVKRLEDVSEVEFGFNFKSSKFIENGEGVPVVRIRDVLEGITHTFTTETVNKKYEIQSGDLLIGMDGIFHMQMWFERGCYLNQRVARIRSVLPTQFVYESIRNELFRLQKTIVGTTVGHLANGDVRGFGLLVPSDESLIKPFKSITDLILNLKIRKQYLAQVRDLLIPELVTGRRELKDLTTSPTKTKQEVFKEAVLFADFVGQSYTSTFFPTHLRTVKYVYFGDRFIGVDPTAKYAESRFGPYNSKSTYAGGEKLALAKKYVQRVQGGFKAGQNIAEINKYTYSERGAVTKVLSLLKGKKDTELELLATVDYIVYSKLKSGETPTEQSVFQYISNSPVWSQKITRLSLTEQMVADCMTFLRQLSKQGLQYPKHS